MMNEIHRRLTMTSLLVLALLLGREVPFAFGLADGNPKNGLSSGSFLRNALLTNPDVLTLLRVSPLNQSLVERPEISSQLQEFGARAVMEEMVKCALSPRTTLTYVNAGTKWTFTGELGLCQRADLPVGDWNAGPPTQLCQELVTACLMARVNGLRKSVPLSLRGEPKLLFPSRPAIGVEQSLREPRSYDDPTEGTPIGSFDGPRCQGGLECRWEPAYVGTCTSGTVSLAIDSPAVCGAAQLRVCAGIHGCYGPTSPVGYPSKVAYSMYLKEQAGACVGAALTFACPTTTERGSYSVMLRRPGPLPSPLRQELPVTKVAGPGSYPATEAEVFSYVEGAFYGNLFDPKDLEIGCRAEPKADPKIDPKGDPKASASLRCERIRGAQVPGECPFANPVKCRTHVLPIPYQNVHACFSLAGRGGDADDALAVAYLNDRLCAQNDPKKTCFVHPPKRCDRRCTWNAASGRYDNCHGEARTGAAPVFPAITTALNAPCDLIRGVDLCGRLHKILRLQADSAGASGAPPGARHPRGCGGCASGAGASKSAAWLVVFGMLLAIARRRRRHAQAVTRGRERVTGRR